MPGRLLLLLILLPLVELAVLIWIAQHTSIAFTLALVLATGIGGAALARWQGWRAVRRIERQLAANQVPADALLDSILIFAAGVLLVIPGVITDLVGLALLFPPTRRLAKLVLVRGIQVRVQQHIATMHGAWEEPRDRIIDVRVVEPAALEDRR
jgi:UPF0716 protein FxsA